MSRRPPSHRQPARPRGQRSTPAGGHVPVMLQEVLTVLAPQTGEIAVDCTLGAGGHALELLQRLGPQGRLIGLDLDAGNLPLVEPRLQATGFPFALHHGNFAGLPSVLAAEGLTGTDMLLADLGMSSMQLDDPERGFSYVRDGQLDMRMNTTRGTTAAQLLTTLTPEELAEALRTLGDEPDADAIAGAIVAAMHKTPLLRTGELAQVIMAATRQTDWRLHPRPGQWNIHPAARTFQALRLLVNRELPNLQALLRALPHCLQPGGRAAIISFHSGEDRLVKAAFRDGRQSGLYAEIAEEPLRPSSEERFQNPRSRSAKLRWARRAAAPAAQF